MEKRKRAKASQGEREKFQHISSEREFLVDEMSTKYKNKFLLKRFVFVCIQTNQTRGANTRINERTYLNIINAGRWFLVSSTLLLLLVECHSVVGGEVIFENNNNANEESKTNTICYWESYK